jgi:hypothetical protein
MSVKSKTFLLIVSEISGNGIAMEVDAVKARPDRYDISSHLSLLVATLLEAEYITSSHGRS